MSDHRVYPVVTLFLAALACGLLVPGEAGAQQTGRRVGVVVSLHVNMSAEEARELAALLGRSLQDELPIETIAGHEVERRLPQAGLPEQCVAESECRHDVGRRLDADELLFLVMVRLGEQVQIDTTWADVASGRVASRPAIILEPGEEAAAVFAEAEPLLLPHIKRVPPGGQQPKIIVLSPGAQERDRHITTGTWIAAGVSAAALVGGAVFGLSAQRKFQTLADAECRTMQCAQDDIDGLRSHALTADLLFATALAGGVTAAILYWRSDTAPSTGPAPVDSRAPVEVRVGPDTVGVTVGGAF